jgi:hypothetical protein
MNVGAAPAADMSTIQGVSSGICTLFVSMGLSATAAARTTSTDDASLGKYKQILAGIVATGCVHEPNIIQAPIAYPLDGNDGIRAGTGCAPPRQLGPVRTVTVKTLESMGRLRTESTLTRSEWRGTASCLQQLHESMTRRGLHRKRSAARGRPNCTLTSSLTRRGDQGQQASQRPLRTF